MNAISEDLPRFAVRPPAVDIGERGHQAAVLCTFNGVQHRATLDVGKGNRVRPADIAAALEALAAKVRAG